MSAIISDVKKLLIDCCACKPPTVAGKTVTNVLEYDTIAAESEVVTLTMAGFVMYLYEKAYNERYPTSDLSLAEKQRIYEIYDALKIPRPVL
jgi:hypothetical protein